MYKIVAIISTLMVPFAATAEGTAVLPVSYKVYRTATESSERAEKVQAQVVKTVEKMGLTPIVGEAVESAVNTLSSGDGTSCIDDGCLSAVADRCGADFSVAVSVVDNDGMFDIKVAVSGVEPSTASPFGTFNAMLKRVAGMVEASLKEAKEKKAAETPPPIQEETVEKAPEPEKDETQDEATQPDDNRGDPPIGGDADDERKRVPKPAFFAVLGVTVGIGAAYGAVTGIGWAKWNDYKETGDYTADDKKQLEHFQLSSRILFGALAAGVITTVVLAPFTRFKGSDKKVAVVPSFSEQMGGVLLKGEF